MMAFATPCTPASLLAAAADQIIKQRRVVHRQYYNGATHQAAMALPNFVRELVKAAGANLA